MDFKLDKVDKLILNNKPDESNISNSSLMQKDPVRRSSNRRN